MVVERAVWIIAIVCILCVGAIFMMRAPMQGITGFASTSGNISVSVNTTQQVRFAVGTIDWGSGSVNASGTLCNMTTEGLVSGCSGFTTVNNGLIIENSGNTNLSIALYSNDTARGFIGSGASFQWKVSNNGTESGSCATTTTPSVYSAVNVSISNQTTVCSNLGFGDSNDSLRVDINIGIPLSLVTSSTGLKRVTINLVGS